MGESRNIRYADVGINLSDSQYNGMYHGKQAHPPDQDDVVQRAVRIGCQKMMVTGSNLKESKGAVELAERYPGICYATIGVHPCCSEDFGSHSGGPQQLITELRELAQASIDSGHTVAFGEIGLDYDRLQHASKDTQLKYFELQLDLAIQLQLPLFLHMRAASEDFERLLIPRLDKLPKKGLVHSFTGSKEEMEQFVRLGFDIGINGCSMKTEENIDVVKTVPLGKLQIETDGPWCEMRPSHASSKYLAGFDETGIRVVKKEKWEKGLMVKGRNESAAIAKVAYAIAQIKGTNVEEVAEA
ncbi:MAG: hypothetical protein Q9227_000844 [Pyrenula ochraceoflavens]